MLLLILIYGIIIGSFLNVCIYRLPREESVVYPSSHCPSCQENLSWYDNIPIVSYITLAGKCRYCGEKISPQYPLIEGVNGIIYILLYLYFGWSINFIFFTLIFSALLVIFIIDLKWMLIPDILIFIGFVLEALRKLSLSLIAGEKVQVTDYLLGFLLAAGLFYLIVVLSKGGMGEGDVLLIGFFGFILGLRLVILNIFLSFILGALISLLLLLFKIKSREDPIPFGPFIIIAFTLSLFYGDIILKWYFNFFIY